jgi:hypothetical protein
MLMAGAARSVSEENAVVLGQVAVTEFRVGVVSPATNVAVLQPYAGRMIACTHLFDGSDGEINHRGCNAADRRAVSERTIEVLPPALYAAIGSRDRTEMVFAAVDHVHVAQAQDFFRCGDDVSGASSSELACFVVAPTDDLARTLDGASAVFPEADPNSVREVEHITRYRTRIAGAIA